MPQLLISVRNADEAAAALAGGADIIDVKDPARGPMGMADVAAIESVLAAVGSRAPLSAALGELIDQPDIAALPPGVAYAKVGLRDAPRLWKKQLTDLFNRNPGPAPIAVAYADLDRDDTSALAGLFDRHVAAVIGWARDYGAEGVLIDTCRKDGRDLFETTVGPRLDEYIELAHDSGLKVALAGSLRRDSFERAVALRPDIVAVRSGACASGDRTKPIVADRVRALAGVIATQIAASPGRAG